MHIFSDTFFCKVFYFCFRTATMESGYMGDKCAIDFFRGNVLNRMQVL